MHSLHPLKSFSNSSNGQTTLKSREQNDQSAVMSCSATGMGPIHYRWEKYESASNEWIRPSHRAVNIVSSKLVFNTITEEDE